jgi:hypothetical protein
VIPGLFTQELPASWTPVPTLLFGLAAIGMVRQPDGITADVSRLADRIRHYSARFARHPAGLAGQAPPSRPQEMQEMPR